MQAGVRRCRRAVGLVFALTLAACSTASSGSSDPNRPRAFRGFDSTLQPLTGPVALEVRVLSSLAGGGADTVRGRRAREAATALGATVSYHLERELGERGVAVSADADSILVLRITDATLLRSSDFKANAQSGGLSLEGFQIGLPDRESLGEFTYGGYEGGGLEQSRFSRRSGIDRAIERFANRMAVHLTPLSVDKL